MVRESRYIKVGQIPKDTTEDAINNHFGKYGKVQSVRFEGHPDCVEGIVAFTDIKAASQAYNQDQMLNGAIPLSIAFCDAAGNRWCEPRCPVITAVTKQETPSSKEEGSSGTVPTSTNRDKNGSQSPPSSDKSKDRRRPSKSPTQTRRGRSKSPHHSRSRSRSNSTGSSRSSRTSRSRKSDTGSKSGGTVAVESNLNRANLGVKITHLPLRSSDTSLRDGLFHEYKKHGKVTGVVLEGKEASRFAIVSFKKPEEAEKALEASKEKHFFGSQIRVEPHAGFECEGGDEESDEPEYDEYHSKATRTLFCGNLEPHTTPAVLKDNFRKFGDVIDIEIKKQGAASSYAFIQYWDIKSVVNALRKKDGSHIGANKIKLGFGKSMPTSCVWLDDLPDTATEGHIKRILGRYGMVTDVVLDKADMKALVTFQAIDQAVNAVNELKIRPLFMNKKLMVDFASWDFQDKYREKLGLPAPPSMPPRRDNDRFNNNNSNSRGGIEGGDRGDVRGNVIRGRGDERYGGGFNDRTSGGGRYDRRNGPPDYRGVPGGERAGGPGDRWNETNGSMSPLDTRRGRARPENRGGGFDSPGSRGGYDEYSRRRRSISPRSTRRSPSPSSRVARNHRFSRSPPPASRSRGRYSRSPPSLPTSGIPRSPRSPRKGTMSPRTPTRDEGRSLSPSNRDGDRPNRRDDWRRGLTSSRGGHASQAGRGSRVSELQKNSAGNTPASSRDSDVESNASVGDHMDELQRKRIELLSQLKGLENDSPGGDATPNSDSVVASENNSTLAARSSQIWSDPAPPSNIPSMVPAPNSYPGNKDDINNISLTDLASRESLDARLSIRGQYERFRTQSVSSISSNSQLNPPTATTSSSTSSNNTASTAAAAASSSSTPVGPAGAAGVPGQPLPARKSVSASVEKCLAASPPHNNAMFKKRKSDKDRSYRSVNPKGGPDEIPINGDGPPREQVLQLWDTLRARTCMSITKPCDLALPKFAASLMQSPRSPSMKRHSMESPLSSPALPSPAIKPFSDFSTERIPIIKTDVDDDDTEDNDGGLSPTSRDIQERIRKLNEKITIADKAISQAPKDIRPPIDLSKYRIVKRPKIDSSGCVNTALSSSTSITSNSTSSSLASTSTSALSSAWSTRPSAFDHDGRRLEGYSGTTAPGTLITPLTPLTLSVPGSSSYLDSTTSDTNSNDPLTPARERLQGITGATLKNKSLYNKEVAPISPNVTSRVLSASITAVGESWKQSIDSPAASLPPKGILRRGSSSESRPPLWTGSDHRSALMGGDSKTQPLIAEVRPLEVKQDNQENVNLTDAVSAVKKESSISRYEYPPPVKQEKPDHSAYESSFGRQTEIKHEPKPITTSSSKRSKHDFKPHVDLFKPDDNAVISTSSTDNKNKNSSTTKNTAVRISASEKAEKESSKLETEKKEKEKKDKHSKDKKHEKNKDKKSEKAEKAEKSDSKTKLEKADKSDSSSKLKSDKNELKVSKTESNTKTDKSDNHKEKKKKEKRDKEKEREQKEREQKEREQREREQKEREQREREQKEREQKEREQREEAAAQQRLEAEREAERQREEKERQERARREREEAEKRQRELERQRAAEKEAAERKEAERRQAELQRERETAAALRSSDTEEEIKPVPSLLSKSKKKSSSNDLTAKAKKSSKSSSKTNVSKNDKKSLKKAEKKKQLKRASSKLASAKKGRVVDTDSESDSDSKEEELRAPTRVHKSSSSDSSDSSDRQRDSMSPTGPEGQEKTEDEKANWMAEYAPYYFESMYDKVKRKRAPSAKAAANAKNKKKRKGKKGLSKRKSKDGSEDSSSSSSSSSSSESDDDDNNEEEEGSTRPSPMSSPTRQPSAKVKSEGIRKPVIATTTDSEDRSPERPPRKNSKPTSVKKQEKKAPAPAVKQEKKLPSTPKLSDDSDDSDDSSEESADKKGDATKQQVIANLWRRRKPAANDASKKKAAENATAAGKKKATSSAATATAQQKPKATATSKRPVTTPDEDSSSSDSEEEETKSVTAMNKRNAVGAPAKQKGKRQTKTAAAKRQKTSNHLEDTSEEVSQPTKPLTPAANKKQTASKKPTASRSTASAATKKAAQQKSAAAKKATPVKTGGSSSSSGSGSGSSSSSSGSGSSSSSSDSDSDSSSSSGSNTGVRTMNAPVPKKPIPQPKRKPKGVRNARPKPEVKRPLTPELSMSPDKQEDDMDNTSTLRQSYDTSSQTAGSNYSQAVSLLIDEPPAPVSAELVEEEPVIEEATLPSPTLTHADHEDTEAVHEPPGVEEDSAAVAALMGGDSHSVTESSADDMASHPNPEHQSGRMINEAAAEVSNHQPDTAAADDEDDDEEESRLHISEDFIRSDIIIPTKPLKSDSEDEHLPHHKRAAHKSHRVTSEDVSRHIDEVITAVSRGEFTRTRGYSNSPPPLSPPFRSQAKSRKRQLTTSSSSDSTAPPYKRSAPPTPQSDMKSPPLSATSLDEPQPFSMPIQDVPSDNNSASPSNETTTPPLPTSNHIQIPSVVPVHHSEGSLPSTPPLITHSPSPPLPESLMLPATVSDFNSMDPYQTKPKVSVAPNNSMSMYSDTSAADNFTSNHNSHHSVAATSLGALSHTSASIGAGDSSTTAAALDSKRRHLSSSTSSEAGKHYPAHLNRQLSSSSSTDSATNSPNKLSNPASFPLQPQQPTIGMSNTALPSPSSSTTSNNAAQQLASAQSAGGRGQRGEQPPQGEQTWESHIDKHIQKSLHPQNKRDFNAPIDMMAHQSAAASRDNSRMGMPGQRQRSPGRSLQQQQPPMHSPGTMMPTTAGPMMAPHPAAMSQEMLFSQFPHAGGDHMTRPPHFPPATAAAAYGMPHHWPGAADQPGGMAPRPFMMHPQMMQHYQYQQIQHQLHQQAVAAQQAQQSPLNSPLPHGLQMMQPPVASHSHHSAPDERKSVGVTSVPVSLHQAQQELASPFSQSSPEEQLRRAMHGSPVVWQGTLALKTELAGVEMFFLCGNQSLPELALPAEEEGLCLLRIVQRMRLERQQLDGVDRKMEMKDDFCILLALPSRDGKLLDPHQTSSLQAGFIDYLKEKGAAGIINVPKPGGHEPAYVVHVFYPCDFSMDKIKEHKPDMVQTAQEYPHLIVIIATV